MEGTEYHGPAWFCDFLSLRFVVVSCADIRHQLPAKEPRCEKRSLPHCRDVSFLRYDARDQSGGSIHINGYTRRRHDVYRDLTLIMGSRRSRSGGLPRILGAGRSIAPRQSAAATCGHHQYVHERRITLGRHHHSLRRHLGLHGGNLPMTQRRSLRWLDQQQRALVSTSPYTSGCNGANTAVRAPTRYGQGAEAFADSSTGVGSPVGSYYS